MRRGWQDPRSWSERLVGLCLTVLLCAVALRVAARLIASVWVELVIAGGIAAVLTVAVAWWRARAGRW